MFLQLTKVIIYLLRHDAKNALFTLIIVRIVRGCLNFLQENHYMHFLLNNHQVNKITDRNISDPLFYSSSGIH